MKYICNNGEVNLIIEEDLPDIGAYLYVYNRQGECIADFLQDDAESCKRQAYDLYRVAHNSWTALCADK